MQSNFPSPFTDPEGFRLLMLGDVMGSAGLNSVVKLLPRLKSDWNLDFIVVNGENSDGFGMVPDSAKKLLNCGVDVLTGGNHTFRPKAIYKFLDSSNQILRPYNLGSKKTPGRGFNIYDTPKGRVVVINLIGQIFMDPANNPFHAFDEIEELIKKKDVKYIIIDFHGEATGEKVAFARYVDGRASVVAGTHTHVQTSDERILNRGTAAITDLGLCGSKDSIIGMQPEAILKKSVHSLPSRLNPAKKNCSIQGVTVLLDSMSGKPLIISRVDFPSDIS
jgi:2',3'-cyclic-nucleotide 2'-phosphodiesterase